MICNHLCPAASSPSIGQRIIRGRWIGKIFIIILAALAVLKLAQGFTESPTLFWQQVINGLQLGFVYALIALGYTMVYGIVRLINFAHGDVFMVGAFASYFAITRYSLHTWPLGIFPSLSPDLAILIGTISVLVLSMAVCALLAITIERIAYKPLRNAPRISALITAIGVSFFLEYLRRYRLCSRPISSPTSAPSSPSPGISTMAFTIWNPAEPCRPTALLSPIFSSSSWSHR